MYEDKLDGRINQDYYDRKSSEWKREQDNILRNTERHQGASRAYMNEGIKLLELSQHAVILYEKQTAQEKRRIINFVCSNSIWKDGLLQRNYRKPFDILVENNIQFHKKMAAFPEKNDHFEFWLPLVDVLRNQFAGPSKEMINTILVAQTQVNDGFLAVRQW